jgi:membrane dipeptidase
MHPLHRHAFVFDAHCDTLAWTLPGPQQRDLRLWGQVGHLDLPRMAAGGINCQVFACFPGEANLTAAPTAAALRRLEGLYRLLEQAPDRLTLVRTAADLRALTSEGPIGAILGLEGAEALDGSLALLSTFFRLGVRVLGLAWNGRNAACDGVAVGDAYGLTPFGRELVAACQQLGIVIDVSHLNAAGLEDVLALSTQPVIASHSLARRLCHHRRNLDDDQLRGIAATGGVIGATFVAEFLTTPASEATLDHLLDHIEHMLAVVGPAHVGLGSDFDGAVVCRGLESGDKYPALTEAMLARGYPEAVIRGILGENFRRVFGQVLPA